MIGLGDNVIDCNFIKEMYYPGGNSLNFAVYAKNLGYKSAYAGSMGNDYPAAFLEKILKKYQVDISHCIRTNGETGRSVVILKNGDRTIIEENNGGVVYEYPIQIDSEMTAYLTEFDLIHTSCNAFIDDQLGIIKSAGVPVLYDFSDLWTESTFERICPDITFAFFSGKDLPEDKLIEFIKKCVDKYGCLLGITTVGIRGAYVYDGRNVHFKAPYLLNTKVEDTTGAGDAWITAFIGEYIRGIKQAKIYGQNIDINMYKDVLIDSSMSAGNLFASYICTVSGAFGNGISMSKVMWSHFINKGGLKDEKENV